MMMMRQRSRLLSRPHSAWEGARLIFDLIHLRRGLTTPSLPAAMPRAR
jgi:hypothetical protein